MDLTSLRVIKEIAEKFGFGFSKGLGQNFLLDRQVLAEIVQAAEIDGGVLEIGPGFGVLTRELCENSKKTVSVEIDRSLAPVLEYTLGEYDNFKLVQADILQINIAALLQEEFPNEKISVAANLPYYITTPILTRLIEARLPLRNIVVMVQKEVAERLAAGPGSKTYGAISVLCRYFTETEIVTVVPAESFYPPPKVDSAVVRLKICSEPRVCVNNEKLFFKVVKAAFAQRRKTLLNCLSSAFALPKEEISDLLTGVDIAPSIRGERLDIGEFAKISDALSEKGLHG